MTEMSQIIKGNKFNALYSAYEKKDKKLLARN